ncbi:MAG: ribose-phosphate pyrophosphokinase [Gammaproteobacteria bacterium]|nr:ribose-phosphate pyrophosphokinase [Gammaproteobacteria bacterium]
MTRNNLLVFALNSSRALGERVAESMGTPLAGHEEREFEDGEHKARPLENVRGRDVFVIQSLYGDSEQTVNDKLVRLLFFIGALKDASAARVTAVIPYLCYSRKDRKTKSRDPVTTRYVAVLLEAAGVDRVVTMDVHDLAAYQNAFRCRSEHLEAKKLFVEYFASRADHELVVVSPDVGGVKRAEHFREALEQKTGNPVAGAFMEKKRSAGVVSGEAVVGDVEGRVAIILDDMIVSGGTIARTVRACHERGAHGICAVATHGLCVDGADEILAVAELEKVVVTDSVPPFRLHAGALREKLEVLSAAPLFAEAIKRIHSGASVVDLLAV